MNPRRASLLLLPIIYLGYISLGLPDGTLGVAWPPLHRDLDLPIGLAGALLLAVTLLSAVSSFSSGRIIATFKTGPVVLVSCALTGSALLLIGNAQNLAWLLAAALPLGLGAGAVDAGLNGYVARHYSGRHMNWLHACWGVGATCGPLLMARAIASDAGWRGGYATIGLVQLTLAAVFILTIRLWDAVPTRTVRDEESRTLAPASSPALRANSPAGWLSAAIFAIYVAIEGTTGLWAGSILVESRGVTPAAAGVCVALYYGSITAGRLASGVAVDRWGNRRLVALGTALALIGAIGFAFANSTPAGAVALVLLGLGFAPVYPCLMHEVPRRFAPEAVQTVIGRQSGASYLGGAALPAIAGSVAQVSLEAIPAIVITGVVALIAATRQLDRMTPLSREKAPPP